jgi:hypothetical protein
MTEKFDPTEASRRSVLQGGAAALAAATLGGASILKPIAAMAQVMPGLQGTWKNEYGSTMVLSSNQTNGFVYGTYSSSTGSTGQYYVFGFYNPNPASGMGNAAGLTIYWRSFAGGPSDPSWHWVSGLGGQVVADGTGNTMILNHAMVATTAFPGLCTAGTYVDKLNYKRVSTQTAGPIPTLQPANVSDPIEQVWICDQIPSVQLKVQIAIPASGQVVGTFTTPSGTYQCAGFTDVYVAGQPLQGFAISALVNNGAVQTLAGSLNLATNKLSMTNFFSQGTASSSTYVQTATGKLTFHAA